MPDYHIPSMPPVNKPRKAHPTNYLGQEISGYVESVESQAQNNWPVIEWFFNHHEVIQKAVRLYNDSRKSTS